MTASASAAQRLHQIQRLAVADGGHLVNTCPIG
jgi:phage-related tail fiber protein